MFNGFRPTHTSHPGVLQLHHNHQELIPVIPGCKEITGAAMAVFGVKQVIFGSVDDESSEEGIIRFVHCCNNQQ